MAFELSETDFHRMENNLENFLELSEVEGAFVCDRGGSVLVCQGALEQAGNADLLAALTAGAFSATNELIRAIGEESPEAIYHQGQGKCIYMARITEEAILFAVHGEQTNIGLIKMYGRQLVTQLRAIFRQVEGRVHVQPEDPTQSFVLKHKSSSKS